MKYSWVCDSNCIIERRINMRRRSPLGPQVIQLRPAPHCRTPILRYALELTPADHILNWQFDPLGNHLARVIFPNKTSVFAVDVTMVADLTPINPFAFFLDPAFETYPFEYPAELAQNLEPYRSLQPAGRRLRAFLNGISTASQNTVAFVGDLAAQVRNRVGYVTRLEHGVQTPEQTLEAATGSCRDSAWLLVEVLRSFGLAARLCFRIPDTTGLKRAGGRPEGRLGRSPRVGRGLSARRRLDWGRPHIGFVYRRRAYSPGMHAESFSGGSNLGNCGTGKGRFQLQPFRSTPGRDSQPDPALQR